MKPSQSPYNKPVHQFDYKGNWLASYLNPVMAHSLTGITSASIIASITGDRPKAGGFLWRESSKATPEAIKL